MPTNPNLGDLLLSFRRKIIEAMKRDGFKEELTFSQMEIVRFLSTEGRHTMKSIAGFLNIAPPSATTLIGEMEKKGLIIRESDKTDRRVVYIALAKKTKKALDIVMKRKEAIMERFVSKLSSKDRKALERIIKILVK